MEDVELLQKAIIMMKKNKKTLSPQVRKELQKIVEPPKTRKKKLVRLNKTRNIHTAKQNNVTRRREKKKKNRTRKIKY